MKIEAGKYYRTECGDRARIYALDGAGCYSIHGAFLNDKGGWTLMWWALNGSCSYDHKYDLVSEWKDSLDFDPYCLPAWAEWIAMDVDGTWYWYRDNPRPRGTVCHVGDHCTPIPEKYAPKNYTGDWKDSLRKVSDLKNHES